MKRKGGKARVCLHAGTWGVGLTSCVGCARNPLRKPALAGILRRETSTESPARGQTEPSSDGAPHAQSEHRCEQAIPGRVCGARGSEPGRGARARTLTAGGEEEALPLPLPLP